MPNRRSAAQTEPWRASASQSASLTAAKKRGVASGCAGRACLKPSASHSPSARIKRVTRRRILHVIESAVRQDKRRAPPVQLQHGLLGRCAHLVVKNDANATARDNRQHSGRPALRWLSNAKNALKLQQETHKSYMTQQESHALPVRPVPDFSPTQVPLFQTGSSMSSG